MFDFSFLKNLVVQINSKFYSKPYDYLYDRRAYTWGSACTEPRGGGGGGGITLNFCFNPEANLPALWEQPITLPSF